VFDLAPFAKAPTQFEHSSEVVEVMLERCLRLRLDNDDFAFGLAGAVVLPSNMVVARPYQSTSLIAWGCYESSCDTVL
jgi:hypothetical protein